MWTRFMDMASGGGCKVKIDGQRKEYIYIELPYEDALVYFQKRFNRDPNNITCYCCGEDYSIDDYDTLDAATEYNRGSYDSTPNLTVEQYCEKDDVLVISAEAIKKSDNNGAPGTDGYFSFRD